MSWSVSAIGKKDAVVAYLQKQSNGFSGESKKEYDAALPHMLGLVGENFHTDSARESLLHLEASGSGTHQGGKDIERSCIFSLKRLYGVLVCLIAMILIPSLVQAQTVIVSNAGQNVFQPVPYTVETSFVAQPISLAVGEAAHTPMSEVVRVIELLPKPQVAFVDFGCGYDARWCVAAAEKWKCKCVGIENDPRRASASRERVRNLGLSHLITITEGDVADVQVSGDVGVAYLYPSVLTRLKPRLKNFKAFASYIHQPPGMMCTKNGDTWIYQPQVQMVPQQAAVWNGMTYSGRVCNSPHCAMCNSIQRQIGW